MPSPDQHPAFDSFCKTSGMVENAIDPHTSPHDEWFSQWCWYRDGWEAAQQPSCGDPPAYSGEFAWEIFSTNAGKLTFRCTELIVSTDEDEFTESEHEFINEIISCLNTHYLTDFPDPPDPE